MAAPDDLSYIKLTVFPLIKCPGRNVTNEHLAEIFGIYGPVVSAEVEKDPRVGLSKGSAYVTFKRSHDMNQAMLHLDGAQIDGNVIKATFVLVSNKRRREPSAGIYMCILINQKFCRNHQ